MSGIFKIKEVWRSALEKKSFESHVGRIDANRIHNRCQP